MRIKSVIKKLVFPKIEIFFSRSRRLASFYYGFISNSMAFEHKGILCGKLKHIEDFRESKYPIYLLRRNIHRIEKGLIMEPRREIFAKEYIKETVDAYSSCLKAQCPENHLELSWAKDILNEFFSVTSNDPVLDIEQTKFKKIITTEEAKGTSIPFIRDHDTPQITTPQFEALAKKRRSVRWFSDQKVPRDSIDAAIMISAQAPSACNRQPYKYIIFDEPKTIQKISSIPMGTKGFSHQFPMVAVVVGDLSAYFDERDRHIIYIDASLSSMTFIYALETQGLSSCIINWPEIPARELELKEMLGLEDYERPIFMIAIGWPKKDAKVPYSQKKSLHELRSYNQA